MSLLLRDHEFHMLFLVLSLVCTSKSNVFQLTYFNLILFYPYFPCCKIVCAKVREGDQRIVRIKEGDPKGRHVVIVDDLVQSGGTLIECQVQDVSFGCQYLVWYSCSLISFMFRAIQKCFLLYKFLPGIKKHSHSLFLGKELFQVVIVPRNVTETC